MKDLKFEVQCRTILMDAWANISHHLAYKGPASIPDHLQRDFHALAGLFYVADKHFELFFRACTEACEDAIETIASGEGLDGIKVDRDTVSAVLISHYRDREPPAPATASEFAEEISAVGYATVARLEADLRAFTPLALAYEKEHPPTRSKRYTAVDLARRALAMGNPQFRAATFGR